MRDVFQKISLTLLGTTRKTRIVSGVSLLLGIFAIGAAAVAPSAPPDTSHIEIRSISEEIKLPSLAEQIATLSQEKHYFMREEKVRTGDTLGSVLTRLGVDDVAAIAFIKSDNIAKEMLQLKAGKVIQAKTDNAGQLHWLYMSTTDKDNMPSDIVVTRTEKGFISSNDNVAIERRIEMRSGVIYSSLFAATDLAEIPDIITHKLVDMFATNIDFSSDLRRGDRFNIVYESFWRNGTLLRSGRILAAEFINAGNTYQAVWFDGIGSRSGGYYSFNGKSQKKAFLKYPLAFTRISSAFSMRKHPITGSWKQHKGIDFAAPTGTPIRSAADGTVESVGRQGGYGNVIVIKHWGAYTTAYGHMSRFNPDIKKGTKVKQGDIIGYVGSTGMSTGPHLHYEFRVNGVQHDPRQIEMPNIQPLTASEMEQFRIVVADMRHRFSLMNPGSAYEKVAAK
ncbi:MAG: peptidoglycan DD-metalloendopeptidase family protein [Betaproteobacteria bacterium]|nr:peptidoglycan DD-metalloendopeptidase family protein [Betaproteobacteria bacterium]